MPTPIEITVEGEAYAAELDDTDCARAILDALPIDNRGNTWGEEIYFNIGVTSELDETASEVVELGTIGYWPPGKAICFFYGQTPMSSGGEIRPASAVNVVGRFLDDTEPLKRSPNGASVQIRAA